MNKFEVGDFRFYESWKSYKQCTDWMRENYPDDAKTINREPAPELLEKVLEIVNRVMPYYVPKDGEIELIGAVIFDADAFDQIHDSCIYGYCNDANGKAVIGFADRTLTETSPTFALDAFLHELAHLSVAGHGTEFSQRYTALQIEFL